MGQFLLQGFERIHELFDLVFGVVVFGVFAFEQVVGFFKVLDQNAMIVKSLLFGFFDVFDGEVFEVVGGFLDSFHGLLHSFHHFFLELFVFFLDDFAAVSHFVHEGLVFVSQLIDLVSELFVEESQFFDSVAVAFFVDFLFVCSLAQFFDIVFEFFDVFLVLTALLNQR
jgi:hypothetical protein